MNITTVAINPRIRTRAWSARQWLGFFRDSIREFLPLSLLPAIAIVVLDGQQLDATACLLGIGAGLAVPALIAVRRYLRWLRWTNE